MINTLFGKIVNGLLSVYMMLLSNYKGNYPQFQEMTLDLTGGILTVEARLSDAFENDFDEIFKSGKPIDIIFNLKIRDDRKVVDDFNFKHTVVYDNLNRVFHVYLEEQFLSQHLKSYNQMLDMISYFLFQYSIPEGIRSFDVELSASLPRIYFDAIEREIDLMMLWYNRVPKISEKVELFNI